MFNSVTIPDSIPNMYSCNKNPYADQSAADIQCNIIVQTCISAVVPGCLTFQTCGILLIMDIKAPAPASASNAVIISMCCLYPL